MEFARQTTVGGLDLIRGSGALDAEDLVVIAEFHDLPNTCQRPPAAGYAILAAARTAPVRLPRSQHRREARSLSHGAAQAT